MSDTSDLSDLSERAPDHAHRRAPGPPPNHQLLVLSGLASAAAGLTHAAAAGSHSDLRVLSTAFAVTAALQVGSAAVIALRPSRNATLVTVAINAVAVTAWVLSRTVGLPWLEGEAGVQAVGTQDLLSALLGLAALITAAAAIAPATRTRSIARPAVALACGALLAMSVPAMAAEHAHDAGQDAGHDAEHDHADGASAESGHDHTATDATADHGHADTEADAETDADTDTAETEAAGGHDHGEVPARLDHEPTAEQLTAAHRLVDETKASSTAYADTAAATAAGYRSIGDGRTGFEHFINAAYLADATILDPTRPESLVYRVEADGSKALATIMYILPPGSTMDDVPDVAGNLTMWHAHDNLCFNPDTGRLSGIANNGRCVPSGVQGGNTPMLHVWVTPNECGPFAGTDKAGMTGSCVPPTGF